MTHSEVIKARASVLANLGDAGDEAIQAITSDILRLSARRMESKLGSQDYGNYVTMFTDNVYDSDIEYHEMSSAQRKLNSLETAEAYYTLYFLALALKRIKKGNFLEDKIQVGTQGRDIMPSTIDQLISMQDRYLMMGDEALNEATSKSSIGCIVI